MRKDEAAFWRHLSAATEGYLWNLAADSVKSREHGMVGAMLKSTAPRDGELRAAFDAEKATNPIAQLQGGRTSAVHPSDHRTAARAFRPARSARPSAQSATIGTFCVTTGGHST